MVLTCGVDLCCSPSQSQGAALVFSPAGASGGGGGCDGDGDDDDDDDDDGDGGGDDYDYYCINTLSGTSINYTITQYPEMSTTSCS